MTSQHHSPGHEPERRPLTTPPTPHGPATRASNSNRASELRQQLARVSASLDQSMAAARDLTIEAARVRREHGQPAMRDQDQGETNPTLVQELRLQLEAASLASRQARRRLDGLFSSLPFACVITDGAGHVRLVNAACINALGGTVEGRSLVGRTLVEFVPQRERELVGSYVTRARLGEFNAWEGVLCRNHGAECRAHFTLGPLNPPRDPGSPPAPQDRPVPRPEMVELLLTISTLPTPSIGGLEGAGR